MRPEPGAPERRATPEELERLGPQSQGLIEATLRLFRLDEVEGSRVHEW
jgi:hypothetical protein